MADIAANVARVQARIADAAARAGRRPGDVRLIAVTKTVDPGRIREAASCGLREFGENRVQEARDKVPAVPGATWHLIGHLQRNKAKEALRLFAMIQSVDSRALAEEVSRRAAATQARIDVLIEVNISGETAKHGVAPEDAEALARDVAELGGVRLCGLMAMAPLVEDAEDTRPYFRRLRELRDRIRDAHPEAGVRELSMGMSNDFEVAVEEGATMVRVGRALFA